LVKKRDKGIGYEIIAGERRWRATKTANLKEIPAVILDVDDRQAMEIALVENVQRQNLKVIEEAEGYKKLIKEFDYTQEQLADVIGKSRSHVTNIIRLNPQIKPDGKAKEEEIILFEKEISKIFGSPVTINDRVDGGEVVIKYKSMEELNQILQKLED